MATKTELDSELINLLIRASPEVKEYLRSAKGKTALQKFGDMFRLQPGSDVALERQRRAAADQQRAKREKFIADKEALERFYFEQYINAREAADERTVEGRKAILDRENELLKHVVEVMKSSNTVRAQNATAISGIVEKMYDTQSKFLSQTDLAQTSTETQTAYSDMWTSVSQSMNAQGQLNIMGNPGEESRVMQAMTEALTKANTRGEQAAVFARLDSDLRRSGFSGGIKQFQQQVNAGSESDPVTGEMSAGDQTVAQFNAALAPGLKVEAGYLAGLKQASDGFAEYSDTFQKALGGAGAKSFLKYAEQLGTTTSGSLAAYDMQVAAQREQETEGSEQLLARIGEEAQKRLPANFNRLPQTQQQLLIRAAEAWQSAEELKKLPVYDTRKQAAFANIQNQAAFKQFFEGSSYTDVNEATEKFIDLQQQHIGEIEEKAGGEAKLREETKRLRAEAGDPAMTAAPQLARQRLLSSRLSQPVRTSAAAENVGGATLETDNENEQGELEASLRQPSLTRSFYLNQLNPTKNV